MAIAIRGIASDGGDPWDGVLDVSGIGIQEGDLLIAINAEGEQHGTGGVWPYDGWTAFTNGWAPDYSDVIAGCEAMYRTAPSSPPSSYSFASHTATPGSVVLIALYSDVGGAVTVDDTDGDWPAELQEPPWDWDAPSVTAAASADSSWLVCAWASTKVAAANAITEDAAMTQRHQNTGSGDAPSLTLATEAVSAGATGTRTATAADATAAWQAFSLVASEYIPPPSASVSATPEPLSAGGIGFVLD